MLKQVTSTAICILVFLLCVLPAAAQGGFTLSQILRTTAPAAVPLELRSFTAAAVSDSGQLAYNADGGVFLRTGGTSIIVAATGKMAPGGGKFIFAGPPAINAGGQVLFQAFTTAPGHSGMFLFANDQVTQLVRDKSAAFPGTAFTFEPPSINDLGDIAFTSDIGIYMKSGTTVSKVAAIGDPVPGGGSFAFFSGPLINHNKQVVFVALTTVGSGIYESQGGTLSKVVASGDSSPFGGQFFFFNFLPAPISLNDAGQIAFTALSSGPSGIFVWNNGALTLPVANNITLTSGEILISADLPSLNKTGDIAFQGVVTGEHSQNILRFSNGTIQQLTSSGQSAPGGGTFIGATNPWINKDGQVSFLGQLYETSGGVFAASATGQISRISGEGDAVPGPARYSSANPYGGFNRKGTAAIFGGTFPGGPGLFLGRTSGTRLVEHTGDPLSTGVVVKSMLVFPSLNDSDSTAFLVEDSNLFFEVLQGTPSAGVKRIARSGDPSPDGGVFDIPNSAAINNLDQVAFASTTTGTSGSGVFLAASGQITELFNQNDTAPGVGAIGPVFNLAVNDRGDVAVFSQPLPGGAILLFSQGTFTKIALSGDHAPGGGVFNLSSGFNSGPFINRRGDVVFSTFLSTGGTAVYRFSQGHLARIAGPGDTVPGGLTLTAANDPTINDAGQVAFTGQVGADFTVYLRNGATIVRVAGLGDVAPGGTEIISANTPKLNNLGQIAFSAGLNIGSSAVLVATPNGTK